MLGYPRYLRVKPSHSVNVDRFIQYTFLCHRNRSQKPQEATLQMFLWRGMAPTFQIILTMEPQRLYRCPLVF